MKRVLTLVLLNVFLLKVLTPAADTFELTKLPVLIDHFIAHKNTSPEMSFWAFLKLHYEDPQHHNEDHRNHSRLPYGTHHHENVQLQLWIIQSPINELSFDLAPANVFLNDYRSQISTSYSDSIWQPPRQA